MKLPCTLKLRHTGSDTKGGGVGPMVTENLSCTLAAAVQDQTLITGGGMTIPINSMVLGKLGTNGDRQTFGIGADGDPSPSLSTAHHHAVCYGINPQGGQMLPFDKETGETLAVHHGGGVMQSLGFKYKQSEKSQKPFAENGESQALSSGCHDSAVALGFKAGQSKDGVKCYDPYNNTESEATPTIRSNAGVSTAGPLAYGADLSQMRYIVRRLTPKEAERLMGLPDGYTIPTGLRRFFDADGEPAPELVAEFQRIHDTFGAIMAEYEHAKPPKPKTAAQVQKWLAKITNPETCPDSPRYKACGNGWATNQPRWILTRLLYFTEQENT